MTPQSGVKRCPGCHFNRPVSQYGKNRTKSDGLQTYCKECQLVRLHSTGSVNARRNQDISRASNPIHIIRRAARGGLNRFLRARKARTKISVSRSTFITPDDVDLAVYFGLENHTGVPRGMVIDHIMPVKAFLDNVILEEDVADAFYQGAINYYKNLRVIPHAENAAKAGHYEEACFADYLVSYARETGTRPANATLRLKSGRELTFE